MLILEFEEERNTSWIPAFAGMTKRCVRNDNTFVIPESTPTVILEIFYRGSSNLSSPTWLGIQCFSLSFSFSVIPEIFKQESMVFFSLTLEEGINTSWIPAFAGMTKRCVRNDREVYAKWQRGVCEMTTLMSFRAIAGIHSNFHSKR